MSDVESADEARFQQIAVELARDNQDALAAVLRELGPALVGKLKQKFTTLLSEEDLEDVLSQMLLRIWIHRKRYMPAKAPFFVWCFFIARNIAFDVIRDKARRKVALPLLWSELREPAAAPQQPPDPALADLERVLTTFAPFDRRLLLASVDRAGSWAAELARDVGMSANALRQRRFRAMHRLRRAMAQLGYPL